jgi:hypothetical protein
MPVRGDGLQCGIPAIVTPRNAINRQGGIPPIVMPRSRALNRQGGIPPIVMPRDDGSAAWHSDARHGGLATWHSDARNAATRPKGRA